MTLTPPPAPIAPVSPRQLVLVGGGHTHVQVLRHFAMAAPPETALTLVVDTPLAIYSGMVPGFVAGQYRADELAIDVIPLARRAGARIILAAATGVDPHRRTIRLAGRPDLPYDIASFDIGSTVAGLHLPGVADHALPTRPIGRFVQRVNGLVSGDHPKAADVVVVGGGAGGIEIAFALRQRLAATGSPRITVVHAGPRLLPGYSEGLVRRVERRARHRDISLRCQARVIRATPTSVELEGGATLPCDLLIWVTGAQAHGLLRDSGLATDDRGFVRVRDTLQVEGHDDLYAVGDCATLTSVPSTPKAGVYAVRQGPYLIHNLRAHLAGAPLRAYRPQRDFLTLLNLGDGHAIGTKWGRAFEGRWVMTWKDRIDRRFMERFQVLDADGATRPAFRSMDRAMAEAAQAGDGAMGPMLCGGCAAKVGQSALTRALARLPPSPADSAVVRGLDAADDVVAVRTPAGDVLVSNLDALRAFTDDPWLTGRVAAVNAVSDLLAKGTTPRHAQALVALPQDLTPDAAEETLVQVIAGARATFDALGITLLGGHSMTAAELTVGFAIEGFADDPGQLLPLDALVPGQRLVLTKALGTGVLLHAHMHGHARGPWLASALDAMLRPNVDAARLAVAAGVTAATDITGFGLVGHLGEMLRRGDSSAEIDLDRLPALPGALPLLAAGWRSTFHPENARARRGIHLTPQATEHPAAPLLFDPHTAGVLLLAIAAPQADDLVRALQRHGDHRAAVIGHTLPPRPDGARIAITVSPRTHA